MASGMRWVRLLTVLPALLFVLANAQCVVRCAIVPCHRQDAKPADLPPCHRHSSPPQETRPCASAAFVADRRLAMGPQFDMVAIAVATPGDGLMALHESGIETLPPVDRGSTHFHILRV